MTALPIPLLALGLAGFLSLAMALAWVIAMRTGKSGYVDAIWSLATGSVSALAALACAGLAGRRYVVALLAAAWGFRLGLHLLRRAGGGDDPRYAALKQEWGDKAPSRMFRFLQVQALAAWPLVLTASLAGSATRLLDWRDLAGVAIILFAMGGEALADAQMARFRRNAANRGRLCDTGLWGWSRHPNYFFEWLVWMGFALIAAGGWGWLALIGPAFIYALLVHVSGIPPLEAHLARSRPAAFESYRQRVSAFWPLPPLRS